MNCFLENQFSNECLETILNTIAEGLIVIDHDGVIKYCNQSLKEMTGKRSDEIIGQKCCSIMNSVCKPPPTCNLFTEGAIINRECQILHRSGKVIPVLKNARVLKAPDGTVSGALETFTDISVLKQTETQLMTLQEHFKKREGFGRLVGKSHVMQELYNLIELASASNATILITGETGTGKELVAQAIHENSTRKDRPVVKINCSALPESLLESELFGHAKGSFTGAIRDKTGRFEIADGGTLFLDEIGELSPLIQVKLLRFLQEKEFERVGENTTRKADVRIIAATHRDLRKRVYDGFFREDLFYRLKVFPLHIPPLRERKEDVGLLIEHFIHKFSIETGKQITGLTHDAAITMMDYCWPGNIRELENAIEHAFVTCQEQAIDMFDLPLEIRKVELRKGICAASDRSLESTMSKTFVPFTKGKNCSDEQFVATLQECNYNQTEAGRRLGIDRTTVWRRMKKLQMLK
jgi:PAS domain S-box-containing protein